MEMIRYETAWQSLILEEERMRRKKGETKVFKGELDCKINMLSHELEYDAWGII
jgi:hypothetical protein